LLPLVLFALEGNDKSHTHSLFTQQELAWLNKNPHLTYVYDPDWAPFEWKNDIGIHTGIIKDIMTLVGETTGIHFIAKNTDTWKESVALVKSEKIHMFSAITQTSEREKYLHFTSKDIFSYPAALVTQFDDQTVYLDIEKDCKNKKIGIVEGSGLGQYIKETYPELNFITLSSTQQGFESLRDNTIDLFAINTITAKYYIEKNHFHDMKIAIKLDYKYHLKMAIHKNLPKEIISILDKGLDSISKDELNDIYTKWTRISIYKKTDWILIVEIVSALLLVLLLLMLWYRKLHVVMYNLLYAKHQVQIEKNQILLEENKQFIADMVHQIRTPLSVIMTNTSLIEMKTDEQVSSYVAQINSAINMLTNSYEDLAYIISNNTIEYKAIEINLTDFLHERIDFFEVIAHANDKTIDTTIQSNIKVTINDTELERLIDNNLSNAIKHSYDKSEIEIVLEKDHSEIVLKFISKGKNIWDVSKLFDKNYTESYGAKRSLGLGLNMVKSICEKNHIHYSAQSEDNTNTFTYIFKV
jgi:signal transduction histidine kinase